MLEADKMSEEEIINRLKERIKIDRSMRLNVGSDFDRFYEEECQAIQGLIYLYNKEKEKNKELQYKLELEKIDNKYNQEERDEETIPKYKIREKITECEEAMNKVKQFNPSTYAGIDTFIYAMAQKNILKSLLEEE